VFSGTLRLSLVLLLLHLCKLGVHYIVLSPAPMMESPRPGSATELKPYEICRRTTIGQCIAYFMHAITIERANYTYKRVLSHGQSGVISIMSFELRQNQRRHGNGKYMYVGMWVVSVVVFQNSWYQILMTLNSGVKVHCANRTPIFYLTSLSTTSYVAVFEIFHI